MNWEAIGAVGEVLGALAVIGTLIYLGRQVSHSVGLTRTSQRQGIMEAYGSWNEMVLSSPELLAFLKRMEDPENEVSEEESVLARHFIYRTCNIYNSAQAAFDSHLINAEEFAFFENDVVVQMQTYPGIQKRMDEILSNYPDAKRWQIYKSVGSIIDQ